MRVRPLPASLLVALLAVVLTACGGKPSAQGVSPKSSAASLESVRAEAHRALDDALASDVRQRAREATVQALLNLLRTPESLRIPAGDWAKPVSSDGGPLARLTESGKVRVYAVALPGPGVVPPGERILVQYVPNSGTPQAMEVSTLAGGKLAAGRALEENGQQLLALAFTQAGRGGFVALFQREGQSGEFRPNPAGFKNLPSRLGDLTLEQKDNFLVVATPAPERWRPEFDQKQPLRLYFDGDMALDWKGHFTVLDERNFSAFQGFTTALDSKVPETERTEAWEKATRKLPTYLQEIASWNEDLLAKLPPGSTTNKDQRSNLAVRVVSIPGPQGGQGFTVVQYRVGGGVPQAQPIPAPGVVEGLRILDHQGLPGLILLSDTSVPGGTARGKAVTLVRLNSGNDWEPAPDWFGYLQSEEGWLFSRPPEAISLGINATSAALRPGTAPEVQLCRGAGTCTTLSWAGGRLGGAAASAEKLKALTGQSVTAQQVQAALESVRQILLAPENQSLSADELANALGRSVGVDVRVVGPDPSTQIVGLPANNTGMVPLAVRTGKTVLTETPDPFVVTRWLDARVVNTGGDRWLVVAGIGRNGGAVLLYKHDGIAWQPAPAFAAPVDQIILDHTHISYQPGQAAPVRGLYIRSGQDFAIRFTSDGQGVLLCEGSSRCVTYQHQDGWQIR